MSPLLILDKLTLRFGGLTAVNQIDAEIAQGNIFSIIGPNGAGKTTVFNAITGIYEPTSGRVTFAGHDMRRPFHWRIAAACILVGLLTALAALLLTANVDRLWWATVKRNSADPQQPFTWSLAWDSFRSYLRGDLIIDRNKITTADGKLELQRLLGKRPQDKPLPIAIPADRKSALQKEAATEYRDDLEHWLALPEEKRHPSEEAGKWVVRDGDKVLAAWSVANEDERERAKRQIETLRQVTRSRTLAYWMAIVAPLLGFVLGVAGTWVVWNRSRRTPEVIALFGLARTFQNIRLFQNMTVLENVLLGMDRSLKCGSLAAILRLPKWRKEEIDARRKAYQLLDFFGLREQAGALAKNLPYGDQRRLEIARALATEPKLLLLDEPAAGMNPAESAELTKLIRRIRDQGITILLIEHHMKVVMQISDRVAVLNYGSKIAEGSPAEVRANPQVIEAYLGKEDA